MDFKNEIHSDDDFDCSIGYNENYSSNNNASPGYNASGDQQIINPNGLSKAELRKTNKPIMEKRRRARINHCLNELKSLILEAMKKDPARHTKLEKADILEMTVKHLQSVQRQQLNMAIQTDPTVVHKFKTGFVECAQEVNRYINQLEGVDVGVRQRLTNHLKNCATNLEQLGSMTNFNNSYRWQMSAGSLNEVLGAALTVTDPLMLPTGPTASVPFPALPQDQNNNKQSAPIQMGGVQLIPSRLPSGEFALIMPNTNATNPTSLLNNNAFSNTTFESWQNAVNTNTNTNTANTTITTASQLSNTTTISPLNDLTARSLQHTSAFNIPQQKMTITPRPTASASNACNLSAVTKAVTTESNVNDQSAPNSVHLSFSTSTSPPLSPISSASSSSQEDDFNMQPNTDFPNGRQATPPLNVTSCQHNFSSVFSTPSSADSSTLSHSAYSLHLQLHQVTSTSESDLSFNSSSTSLSRKRSFPDAAADSSDSLGEPLSKKIAGTEIEKWERDEKENEKKTSNESEDATYNRNQGKVKGANDAEGQDCMWRPW